MNNNKRTVEDLLSRRALAEKATPEIWKADNWPQGEAAYVETSWGHLICDSATPEDTEHIAANDPATVMADIDEILRLRAEVERLEKEADWLAQAAANAGWSGVRTGPRYLREAARKAVEGRNG